MLKLFVLSSLKWRPNSLFKEGAKYWQENTLKHADTEMSEKLFSFPICNVCLEVFFYI